MFFAVQIFSLRIITRQDIMCTCGLKFLMQMDLTHLPKLEIASMPQLHNEFASTFILREVLSSTGLLIELSVEGTVICTLTFLYFSLSLF